MGWRDFFGIARDVEDIDVNGAPDQGVVQIGLKDIRKALETDGYETQLVDQIVNGLETRFTEKIQEKRVLDYDEFMTEVTEAIKGIYSFPDERIKICKRIDDFLQCNPEIQNSIRLYASYIVYGASEVGSDEYTVRITGEEQEEVEKAREFITEWEDLCRIRRYLYLIAKDVVAYGDAFLEKIVNGSKVEGVAYAPSNTFLMKVEGTETPLNYYQILDPNVKFTDIQTPTSLSKLLVEKKVIEFQPEEIAHFSDGTLPGTIDAPLGSLTILWRFMRLIEEAFVIHRVTRARRMMVFFLDVTGKTKEQIRKAVTNFTSKLKSIFQIRPDSGSIHEVRSNIPSSSDLVIPITKESATKVQPIQSDPSAAKIDDLRFYLNRILANMLTLHIFSTSEKDKAPDSMEKAFSRIIKIYQKQLAYTLKDLYSEVLDSNGYKDLRVTIEFPAIDNRAETEMVESVVRRAMILNQLVSVLGYAPPSEWSIRYIFKDISSAELDELVQLVKEAEAQKAEQEAAAAAAEAQQPTEQGAEQAALPAPQAALPAPAETTEISSPPSTLSYEGSSAQQSSGQQIKLLPSAAQQAKPETPGLPDELVYGVGAGTGMGQGAPIGEQFKKKVTKSVGRSYNSDSANKALEIAVSYLNALRK